jgi:predicted ATPase
MRLYREWSFGRYTPPRRPQKSDLPNDFLAEDGRNLGLVLNRLARKYEVKQRILTALHDLYDGVSDFHVNVEYGTVQVFMQEGNVTVPATRISDGTLRYLCLLAILCNPDPPPLVCIEEPELGLHPDVIPALADLLREASKRCQLIVTTHSDTLIDALTETPESVVVCEKINRQTTLKRLDKSKLAHWLDKYRLGELWSAGELGGNRW